MRFPSGHAAAYQQPAAQQIFPRPKQEPNTRPHSAAAAPFPQHHPAHQQPQQPTPQQQLSQQQQQQQKLREHQLVQRRLASAQGQGHPGSPAPAGPQLGQPGLQQSVGSPQLQNGSGLPPIRTRPPSQTGAPHQSAAPNHLNPQPQPLPAANGSILQQSQQSSAAKYAISEQRKKFVLAYFYTTLFENVNKWLEKRCPGQFTAQMPQHIAQAKVGPIHCQAALF